MRSKRQRLGVAGIVALMAATLTPVVGTVGAAEAVTCKAYIALGVRGTGESPAPSGVMIPSAVSTFVAMKGSGNVAVEYIKYPASTDYVNSMTAGRSALRSRIAAWRTACPKSKLALFGYSQGAHIVGDVVRTATSSTRAAIQGVGLIGDPMFNPNLRISVTGDRSHGGMFGRRDLWPAGLFVYDVCNKRDQVCASYSQLQSLGYLAQNGKEHAGYRSSTYSPIAGKSGTWLIGYHVATRS